VHHDNGHSPDAFMDPAASHAPMSALRQKRTFAPQKVMSAYPKNGHVRCN
jgi:hypothetical protein